MLLDTMSCPIFDAAKQPNTPYWRNCLTVGLLVPGAGTGTSELLGLAPPVVGDEECAVVLDEGLLELVLGVLVDVLLVVGDDGLGDGLADGVDLRGVTTTGDADADVDVGWGSVSCVRSSFLGPHARTVVSRCGGDWAAYRTCRGRGSGRARRP